MKIAFQGEVGARQIQASSVLLWYLLGYVTQGRSRARNEMRSQDQVLRHFNI